MTTATDATSGSAQGVQILPLSKLWRVGLIAAVGASLVNLVFFWITKGLFDIPYLIPIGGPSGPLGLLPVGAIIIFNVLPAAGATVLLALLGKYRARPMRLFWTISAVAFVLSYLLPITLPSTVATATRIGLGLMHIIAVVVIVGALTKLGREK